MSIEATPWVLLRGLMRDRRHWGRFIERFAERFPGAPVVTIDFPGNGELHEQRSLPTIGETADFCRAELQRRGIAPPYRVLAMSMGAMVAASWATRYPDELEACVLINTSLRPFSRFWQRLRPGVYPSLLKMAFFKPDARESEAIVLRLTTASRDRGVLDDWTAWREAQPVSTANALWQLASAMRYVASRDAPRVRMLVLAGAKDRLVHPACSRKLAKAWGCEIREHPSAGHDLPFDDGEWVAAEVETWSHA
ncbi:MAG: alpha/beta hydrolase [Hydrocarboniphaga sp.]|uniref:alpha/beta fold hydrolase n=1 Tax=Hydrocarboniphaga sp. TaxID=2033016 RepID=UPI002634E8DC|nr:alpha/beta hydrolase [Hydrocarboniphaga sp.]MDB5973059.1 alpha/beta hydrolase [Hydrocarboniphaga sp.]